jgi:hypothetical protein
MSVQTSRSISGKLQEIDIGLSGAAKTRRPGPPKEAWLIVALLFLLKLLSRQRTPTADGGSLVAYALT